MHSSIALNLSFYIHEEYSRIDDTVDQEFEIGLEKNSDSEAQKRLLDRKIATARKAISSNIERFNTCASRKTKIHIPKDQNIEKEHLPFDLVFKDCKTKVAQFNSKSYLKTNIVLGKGAYKTARVYIEVDKEQKAIAVATAKNEEGHSFTNFTNTLIEECKFLDELQHYPEFLHPIGMRYRYSQKNSLKFDIATELCDRGDLESFLKSQLPDHKQALDFALGIIRALIILKEKGIVHRDLKPGNIFLITNENGEISLKIADFGTAIKINTNRPSLVAGTPLYFTPELLTNFTKGTQEETVKKIINTQGDVWAAGLIFYQMITGENLFSKISHSLISNFCSDFNSSNTLLSSLSQSLFGTYSDQTVIEMERIIRKEIAELDPANPWKRLLLGMLEINPEKRFTPEQCLMELEFIKKSPEEKEREDLEDFEMINVPKEN